MISTSFDAIKRFEPLKNVHTQISGNNFVDSKKKPINMNGAVSCGRYVYVTNAHYIGRILVDDDNADEQAVYYDYDADAETGETVIDKVPIGQPMSADKQHKLQELLFYDYTQQQWRNNDSYLKLVRYNLHQMKQYFLSWRKYCLKLRKNDVLEILRNVFGNSNSKLKHHYVIIAPDTESEQITLIICRKSLNRKDMNCTGTYKIPMHMYKKQKSDIPVYPPVSLCAMYLMRILEAFEEYDIVDLNYDELDATSPNFVTIKGVNPRNDTKPDIRFILGRFKHDEEKNND